jgi:hypothetical protein
VKMKALCSSEMVGTAYPVTVSHPRALAFSEVSYIFIVYCILCMFCGSASYRVPEMWQMFVSPILRTCLSLF